MNPENKNEADAIRSDIEVTRRRMDDTMDALTNRLQGRHIIDEIIGLFRGNAGDGDSRLHNMKERISTSASSAVSSVVDTVKANPLPALVIGAGVAWMIYESRRDKSQTEDWGDTSADDMRLAEVQYDPDVRYDTPLEYPSSSGIGGSGEPSKFGSMAQNIGDKASAARDTVKDKLSSAKQSAGEKMHAMRERAGEMSGQVRERAQMAYTQTRERVVTTAQDHPLELGLGLLAAGLLIGLAIPTPGPVNRIAGRTADRLRERTRQSGQEMLEKGKRVGRAATDALKEEARNQGLTIDALRDKAGAVAEHTKDAASEAAQREGLGNMGQGGNDPFGKQQNPSGSDPSLARPGM